MSKTTFQERFDRANKFYDNIYHHHKATFKGLAQFFKNYYSIEKEYANSLIKLSSGIDTSIIDFTTELPFIQQGIRQICANIAQISQLHFNYGERLSQVSDYFREEYAQSKRSKQKFMKLRVQKSQQEHTKVKESKNRLMLNQKEKQICRSLYQGLEQYLQDETLRTQKLKEQMVIYFSVSKRIAEKSLELNGTYAVKMAQQDIQIKVPQLSEIEDMLIDQFNAYGEEKLNKKIRDVSQQVTINRESLKDSILKKEKQSRVQDSQTKIFKLNEKYQQIPQELNYPKEEDHTLGLFDIKLIPNYRVYSREFKSEIVKELTFAWLSSYYQSSDDEVKSLLTIVKTNLKIKSVHVSKVGSMRQFYEVYSAHSEQYRWNLLFLSQLSAVYDGRITLQQLDQQIRNRKIIPALTKCIQHPLHWKILLVFVDSLLDSTVIIRQGFSLLYDEYIDILKIIIKFAKEMLNIDASVVLLLLLRKLQRVLTMTNSPDEEHIQQILQQNWILTDEFIQTEPLKMQFGHRLIHFLTSRMTVFYKCKVAFSNLVKMSLILEKIMPKNYFSAVEHMHKCIKIAGYNFFVQSDEDHKLVQIGIWRGQERLKNLTEVLEQAEYNQILQFYIAPMATQLSKLLGVGVQVISGKMMREFSLPMHELTQAHLNILCQQQGVDRQGYVLRLGLCLAEYDISQPQQIDYYDPYFKVLQTYLTLTEKDYNDMLEHSRKTQLWIVSENSQATQNCIDFCSLLYKPFQFLLTSLKKLQEGKVQTQFTSKYTDFIKLRLNSVLKSQIEKYVKFLSDSLSGYQSKESQISLKPKKYTQVLAISVEDLNKQRYNFKEMSRRLYNLLFLKDQLDQIVSDFIDKAVYEQMKCSIFNLQALQLAAGREKIHKQLLSNIYQIASLIVKSEEKLVREMAAITIYHFMRRLFINLYFQEEKGFFATKQDYKLSDLTFIKSENQIEETLINISRNLPAENFQIYARQFCLYFFKAYRCELLNPYKFKIPIATETMTNHLKSDLAFVCTCLKQKFTDAAMVRDELEEPAKKLFKDLQKPSQRVMQSFSEATNKNNNEQARYFLAILNLKRDDKAQEYVQKYKKVLK